MRSLAALCLLVLLAGTSQAQALKYVVQLSINVNSSTFTCNDWFAGTANNEYLAALATYNLGQTPAVSCRQLGQTVHTMELVGAEPGANMLFDDPRKVTEAVAQLRNIFVTNRVSLYVDFYYSAADTAASQAIFNTLNANVRSGDFLAKVAKASTPLLTAAVYQEVFNQGVACTIA